MKNKILSSLALAGILTSSASAVDFNVFGHIGTAYNFGIDKSADGQKPWFGGFTGRVGFEVGMGPVSLGLGFAGGMPYAIKPDGAFRDYIQYDRFNNPKDVKWYNWMSDAYLRLDTAMFSFIGGRYDLSEFYAGKDGETHTGVDWIAGMNEGMSFKLDTRYFAWWGNYSYETMHFGSSTPNRLGSDLMGFRQYSKAGHLLSTGFDINIKEMVYIDPFVSYDIDQKYLQAGGKLQANFGKGFFKSKTILRGMYQFNDGVKSHTFLAWADQEFKIANIFKFGAGGYYVGKEDGIVYRGENTRFYGATFSGDMDYFSADGGVWYVFAGIEHKYFNLDLLYADGRYEEISAIAQVNVYKNQWSELGIGGGWLQTNKHDQGVAFVKLSF